MTFAQLSGTSVANYTCLLRGPSLSSRPPDSRVSCQCPEPSRPRWSRGWSQEWSQEPADGHGDLRMLPDAIMSPTCANADLNGSARTATDPLRRSSNPTATADSCERCPDHRHRHSLATSPQEGACWAGLRIRSSHFAIPRGSRGRGPEAGSSAARVVDPTMSAYSTVARDRWVACRHCGTPRSLNPFRPARGIQPAVTGPTSGR